MLLAHLRGLLKPYYEQGVISQGAERMVLRGLASELHAQRLKDLAVAESQNLSLVRDKDRKKAWQTVDNRLEKADRRRRLITVDPAEDRTTSEIDSMSQLFYALEKVGIIKDAPTDG